MSGNKLTDILSAASSYRDEGLIKIKDDRILIKVMDPSESGQFACLIPETATYGFEPRGVNSIAVNYELLSDFIPNTDEDVILEYEQYNNVNKLSVRYGESEVRVGTIPQDEVADVQASIPDFDMPVKFVADPDILFEFTSKCNKIGIPDFMISPREGTFYLYGRKDDNEVIERIPWEDFNSYDIDWSKGNIPEDFNNPPNPSETHAVDVILSRELVEAMAFWTDRAMFHIDNHMPIKAVFEDEDGIKVSWLLAPRIPEDKQSGTLPDNVIQERGLEEMTH